MNQKTVREIMKEIQSSAREINNSYRRVENVGDILKNVKPEVFREGDRVLTSNRRFMGPFFVFFKKVIIKILNWYFAPIMNRQNEFNGEMLKAITELTNEMKICNQNIINISEKIGDNELLNMKKPGG
ncbi:hypothetical protein [Paenibacillus sp. GCM10012303]|uniref:hypothetical protein n=1 Tax=Paenibacillus sp. GCM10012303 TaxID=3317340 RepID=UPI00360A2C66